jgi:hypothetical protein
VSLKRERDTKRILDLGNIESGLEKYRAEFGFYPLSSEKGLMVACNGPKTTIAKDKSGGPIVLTSKKPVYVNLVECDWGKDPLGDALDLNYPAYLSVLPQDPLNNQGVTYLYKSDGKSYLLLASLELKEEKDFNKVILTKKIMCGTKYCNFGRGNIVELNK